MRWKNGAPKKLYALVINETGEVLTFERRDMCTAFVAKRTPTYADGTYVFATFLQEEK